MIPQEQKVGKLLVIYNPDIDMMGIAEVGELIPVRAHIEEVKRLNDEPEEAWHARAVARAEELQK